MEKDKKKEVDKKIEELITEIQDRNTTNEFQDIMKKRKANIFFLVFFIIVIAFIVIAVIFMFNAEKSEKENTAFMKKSSSLIVRETFSPLSKVYNFGTDDFLI
ncbi:MAG: hypothetical protein B6D62_04285 [Candidatus Cloacimonas sp. 4484_275]|nr:MAG: hypothetical protein B6D62_04285 [Candidatus Cloacimonas sp. 4484_275]